MKTVEKKRVATEIDSTEVRYTCSRCGKPSGASEDDNASRRFEISKASIVTKSGRTIAVHLDPPGFAMVQDVAKVEIEGVEGSSYPEGANEEKTVIDCCRACFVSHAVPALIAAGFQVREEHESW